MTKQLANSAEFSKVPCDILISTPLRLKFAVTKRKLDLSRLFSDLIYIWYLNTLMQNFDDMTLIYPLAIRK